jgi:hypothetical protein
VRDNPDAPLTLRDHLATVISTVVLYRAIMPTREEKE